MNNSIKSQLERLRQWENFSIHVRDPYAAKMLALNSKEIFKSVEQDVHSLKYKLKRLVCNAAEDAHIVLNIGYKQEDVVIIPETWMFFKC